MDFAHVVRNAGVVALMCMLIPVGTLGVAVAYAVRPDERRLGLMRPLSLATIFAGLCAFTVGAVNVFRHIGITSAPSPEDWQKVALGTAESLVPLFVAFGCLTIAWLAVALGMRRTAG